MLYCCMMEVFEEHTIFPSLFQLRNLVGWLHCDLTLADSFWNTQLMKPIRLHKQCKSVSGYFLSSNFAISDHTMRRGFKIPSAENLCHFTQLVGNHIRWNCNSGHFCESVLSKEPTIIRLDLNFLSILVNVHGRSQWCQSTMIIVPSTPVSFGSSLFREGKIVQHSANVLMSLVDYVSQMRFFISFEFLLGSSIDLMSQQCPCLDH